MNIHEHNVRFKPRKFCQRLLGGRAGEHTTKSRCGINPLTEGVSHHRVVFHNRDGIHGGGLGTVNGRCRETVVPAPGRDASSQRPCNASTRSRILERPCPLVCPEVSKPVPLSVIEIHSRLSSTWSRKAISVAPPWRRALFRASFTARKRLCRTSPD